jgi:hypothetical protein
MNDRYYLNFDRLAGVAFPLRAWTDYPFRELGDTGNTGPVRPVVVTGHDDDKRAFVTVLDGYDHETGRPVLDSDTSVYRVWVESAGMQRTPIPAAALRPHTP